MQKVQFPLMAHPDDPYGFLDGDIFGDPDGDSAGHQPTVHLTPGARPPGPAGPAAAPADPFAAAGAGPTSSGRHRSAGGGREFLADFWAGVQARPTWQRRFIKVGLPVAIVVAGAIAFAPGGKKNVAQFQPGAVPSASASPSPEPTESETPDPTNDVQELTGDSVKPLSNIADEQWFKGLKAGDIIAEAKVRGDGTIARATFPGNAPADWQGAFMGGLRTSTVELAADSGELKTIVIVKTEGDSDFTTYNANNRELALHISGFGNLAAGAVIVSPLDVRVELMRGAAQALDNDWRQVLDGKESDDEELNTRVDRVRDACRAVNGPAWERIIDQRGAEISQLFLETATNVDNYIIKEQLEGEKLEKALSTAAALRKVSDAILKHDREIMDLGKEGCQLPNIVGLANAAAPGDGKSQGATPNPGHNPTATPSPKSTGGSGKDDDGYTPDKGEGDHSGGNNSGSGSNSNSGANSNSNNSWNMNSPSFGVWTQKNLSKRETEKLPSNDPIARASQIITDAATELTACFNPAQVMQVASNGDRTMEIVTSNGQRQRVRIFPPTMDRTNIATSVDFSHMSATVQDQVDYCLESAPEGPALKDLQGRAIQAPDNAKQIADAYKKDITDIRAAGIGLGG